MILWVFPSLDCAPADEIDEKINGAWVVLSFVDYLVNQKDRFSPFSPVIKEFSTKVSANTLIKQANLRFRVSHLETIFDFFYYFGEERKEENRIQYSEVQEYSEFSPDPS
jgi:hypothetical protein